MERVGIALYWENNMDGLYVEGPAKVWREEASSNGYACRIEVGSIVFGIDAKFWEGACIVDVEVDGKMAFDA